MSRRALPRILMTALLLLALVVPSARAAEPATAGIRSEGFFSLADLLGRAWEELLHLWPANGCIADPSGRCAAGQILDNGCGLDPHGGCAARQVLDNGCGADPWGGCGSGS